MNIHITSKQSSFSAIDLLLLPLHIGEGVSAAIPEPLRGVVTEKIRMLQFKATWGQVELFPAAEQASLVFIGLIGLGDRDVAVSKRAEGFRRAVAAAIQDSRRHGVRRVGIMVPDTEGEVSVFSAAAVEAVYLIDYWFASYKKKLQEEQAKRSLQTVTLLVDENATTPVKQIVKKCEQIMAGVSYVRDLVNQPASSVTPKALVDAARQLKKESRRINLTVFNKAQADKKGFKAFLAVARGSQEDPYVIHLHYKPAKKAQKKIALVGKGITFDSGGLSLKPAPGMEAMKIDMAGAATVLGVFSVIAKLELPVEVHGIIATCENMPSGDAYRPGDILETMYGKTIEVLNTDAEGRITLADALCYAEKQKPDAVIDLATLTGACIVALGDTHAGLWSTNDELRDKLLMASKRSGESVVPLPLPEEYAPTVHSRVADVRNTSTAERNGGAITAALFLREFIKDTPWAHLDVAGPVYAERALIPYWNYGATGFGVRLLVSYLENL